MDDMSLLILLWPEQLEQKVFSPLRMTISIRLHVIHMTLFIFLDGKSWTELNKSSRISSIDVEHFQMHFTLAYLCSTHIPLCICREKLLIMLKHLDGCVTWWLWDLHHLLIRYLSCSIRELEQQSLSLSGMLVGMAHMRTWLDTLMRNNYIISIIFS